MAKTDTTLGALNPPVTFGNYLLLERLGFGPVIEVYRAKTVGIEGFERFVSLRRLRPDVHGDADTVRTFIDDAKRASSLQHANIAQVVDLGKAEDQFYVAAEFVDGPNLKAVTERAARTGRRLPLELSCLTAVKILEGLEYAHNRTDEAGQPLELLHSGIAPDDVGLSSDGQVKLLRFSATSFHRNAAGPGVSPDRLGYMSPEQVRGLPLDRRSDTFAVGIILHELLTGRRLFTGDTDFETLEKIRKVEVTPPSLLNPDVPPELEEIVLRALSRQPQARYQTAGHMARDLQRFGFQSEAYGSEAELRAYLSELFPELYEGEDAEPPPPPIDELDWDEEEVQTAVFGRRDSDAVPRPTPPAPSEELGEWSRDLATGVHKRPTAAQTTGPRPPVSDLGDPLLVADAERPASPEFTLPNPDAPGLGAASDTGAPSAPTSEHRSASTSRPTPRAPSRSDSASDSGPRSAVVTAAPPAPRASGTPVALWAVGGLALVAALLALLFLGKSEPDTRSIHVSLAPANLQYELQLDGQTVHQGAVPHAIAGVAPGSYELTARAPGHLPHTETVVVEDGNDVVVNWQLQEIRQVTIPFRSTPAGATVLIGGEPRGVTPIDLELPVGERVQLELQLDGYDTHSTGFVVSERASTVTIAMSAVPTGTPSADAAAGDTPGTTGAGGAEPSAEVAAPGNSDPPEAASAVPSQVPEDPVAAAQTEREADESDSQQARAELAASSSRAAPSEEEPSREEPSQSDRAEEERRDAEREAAERREREAEALAAERRAREERIRAERERAEREAAEQAANQPPGFLNVQSVPPATVVIDGETVGQTPLNGIPVAPGRHRVELVNEAAGLERTYRVSIDSGQARTIVNRSE